MEKVIVIDISMKFVSMVIFMIKWALASIPAMVMLLIFYIAIALIISIIP